VEAQSRTAARACGKPPRHWDNGYPDSRFSQRLAVDLPTGAWCLIKFETDYLSRQYKGPGTYAVKAAIYPRAPDVPTDPIYSGSVQLTVSGYRAGRWAGSVSGTLDWTGATTEKAQVNISGSWTCTNGPMTGPG
jgi:hypothetical protein